MIDWSKIRKDFDTERRKSNGQTTGKELMAKARDQLLSQDQAVSIKKSQVAALKPILLHFMVNKLPITVMKSIQNPTETVGGKTEDEDNFYHSVQKSLNVVFQEVMETIPAGTQLTYHSWDKQIGQWIFKSSTGREYAIYDKDVIMFMGNSMENPGLYGLLFNTNLVDYVDTNQ